MGSRLLLLVSAASVGVSLVVRLVHRGDYYPGFDVVGAAHGLYLLSTRPWWQAVANVFYQSRHYLMPFPYYSVIGSLLPGSLAALWPWEQWGAVVTFVLFLLALRLVWRASDLRARDTWFLLLAVGASPALLSFAIVGFPWSTAILPHALALLIVQDVRLRRRWLATLALCLLTNELSWHVYELGKTVFLVFLLAAVLLENVPWRTRMVWLLAGVLLPAEIYLHPSSHVAAFSHPDLPEIAEIGRRLWSAVEMVFVTHYVDLPLLVVAGLLSLLVPTRKRVMLLLLLLVQVALVAAIAIRVTGAQEVRPRRFLMVDFYCLVLAVSLYREARGGSRYRQLVRGLVVAVLLAGNVWQLVELDRWARAPLDFGFGFGNTMPFTQSQVDYLLRFEDVDWYRELRSRADAGEKLLLVYNLGAYDENYTNPEAVLERLYLHLGHTRFVDSVFAFGSVNCHHDCLPIHPMQEVPRFLDGIGPGGTTMPAEITGYAVARQQYDTEEFAAEREYILAELRKRFTLQFESPASAKYVRFTLRSLEPTAGGELLHEGGGDRVRVPKPARRQP